MMDDEREGELLLQHYILKRFLAAEQYPHFHTDVSLAHTHIFYFPILSLLFPLYFLHLYISCFDKRALTECHGGALNDYKIIIK